MAAMLGGMAAQAQTGRISGEVSDAQGAKIEGATVSIPKLRIGATADDRGNYALENVPNGSWQVEVKHVGYRPLRETLTVSSGTLSKDFRLEKSAETLEDVVITGTMREMSKLESPVPVEVYIARFFKANPTPSVFEALQTVNGVRPTLNCNVCNTGDIHINGLEGPYTMVLIDGMPIVSGLATVYGLSGIPQSLIDRVEVVKGPASTLYGSEAVGGLINVITKRPGSAPVFSADVFGTSWEEVNADLGTRFNLGTKAQSLLGLNYFNYSKPIDKNADNFTDVTLQKRVSVFNKWNFDRRDGRIFTLAGRYVYEDRWGGEMNWKRKQHRGGDEVYAESIYTKRWEAFGTYQLPVREKILFQFSANGHDQNSVYGDEIYIADQKIAFGQMTWFKTLGSHELLTGIAHRYTYYDDNTPATADALDVDKNKPDHTHLPGLFVQDEIALNGQNKLLLGIRYDHHSTHGSIFSPRINYKWNSANNHNVLRLSLGNGYRVVNVFTEEHASLTGARTTVIANALKPEKSWNGNLNFVKKIPAGSSFIGLDATAFYTYFDNKIIPEYTQDGLRIIYDNLDGHAISQGVSLNLDVVFANGLKILAGATAMDVYSKEDGVKERQEKTERFSGTWNAGYTFKNIGLTVDYTGNVYGPMRLPLLEVGNDPRPEYSPWWSTQNIQLTKTIGNKMEVYGGVKNLLNWLPTKGIPFLIARPHDPFDKLIPRNAEGDPEPVVTTENPYGLKFDPDGYSYAPNQGIRGFLGLRYTLH